MNMDTSHRFTLEPYKGSSTRFACPKCGKAKEFTRYLDTEVGERLPDHVGKCNRVEACGYHYTPRDHFRDSGTRPAPCESGPRPEPPPRPHYLHTREEVAALLKGSAHNTLSAYWRERIGPERWDTVRKMYALGTWPAGPMKGAAVYWQIDALGKVKAGKVMLYDPSTGKRSKGGPSLSFVHYLTIGKSADELNVEQCLFGEHLLKGWPMDKPVGVVESEKTAMICAALAPSFCWVAVGSRDTFTVNRLQGLAGRHVVAFPDLGLDKVTAEGRTDPCAFVRWSVKLAEFGHLFASARVSPILENGATDAERQAGIDIADRLMGATAPAGAPMMVQDPPMDPLPPPPPPQADPVTVAPPRPRATVSDAGLILDRWTRTNPALETLIGILGMDTARARVRPYSEQMHA